MCIFRMVKEVPAASLTKINGKFPNCQHKETGIELETTTAFDQKTAFRTNFKSQETGIAPSHKIFMNFSICK